MTRKLTIHRVRLWCDSKMALFWLGSHFTRWNIFITNRVSAIQTLTDKFLWEYVESSENLPIFYHVVVLLVILLTIMFGFMAFHGFSLPANGPVTLLKNLIFVRPWKAKSLHTLH